MNKHEYMRGAGYMRAQIREKLKTGAGVTSNEARKAAFIDALEWVDRIPIPEFRPEADKSDAELGDLRDFKMVVHWSIDQEPFRVTVTARSMSDAVMIARREFEKGASRDFKITDIREKSP